METATANTPRTLQHFWLGNVAYRDAWALQQQLAEMRADGEIADCVLTLEHPPVYTVGRKGEQEHLGAGEEYLRSLGADFVEVDRGGSVTFHGPGQLVAYPIVKLNEAFPIPGDPEHGDAIAYVRALEEALILTLADYGISATRRDGKSGAWVGMNKIAAIGVKLSHGVTLHGIALNIDTDLKWFGYVTPCGITDGGVTSMAQCGVAGLEPEDLAPVFARHLAAVMGSEFQTGRTPQTPVMLAAV